ncbi:MAG TPA: cytochrome c maturation protein CcmE [Fimbriimonadaceae bacterium]|nr:cytochrome c maturation protein CcmE [Fimbriimonadaceae bacterium]
MKKSASIVTGILTGVGLCAVVFAFVKNSSPYVNVAEARTRAGDSLHLAGDMDKSSLSVSVMTHTVSFRLTDENGESVNVVYKGIPPANMSDATQVVAIGSMKGDHFESHKLLLKCPSKYEDKANNPT